MKAATRWAPGVILFFFGAGSRRNRNSGRAPSPSPAAPPASRSQHWPEYSRIQTHCSFCSPLGAENARTNIEGEYRKRDDQGSAPRQLLPIGVGALHEVVDGHRQIGHRLGLVEG